MKNFLQQTKFINSWAISHENSKFGSPGDVVLIYNNGENRRMRTIPYADQWYFYIKKTEENIKILKGKNIQNKIGENWIRVYYPKLKYNDQNFVNFIRDLESRGIETYEADVGPVKRLALDCSFQIEDWDKLRILFFDIETDDTIDGLEIGRDRILSFAGVDKNGKEYFLTGKDDGGLLCALRAVDAHRF
ncbi:MAG: hypothetical protein AABY22_34870, partial [Nanoarchaeota archaeon]